MTLGYIHSVRSIVGQSGVWIDTEPKISSASLRVCSGGAVWGFKHGASGEAIPCEKRVYSAFVFPGI